MTGNKHISEEIVYGMYGIPKIVTGDFHQNLIVTGTEGEINKLFNDDGDLNDDGYGDMILGIGGPLNCKSKCIIR